MFQKYGLSQRKISLQQDCGCFCTCQHRKEGKWRLSKVSLHRPMDNTILQLSIKCQTHPSSASLTDLQVDQVAKKVFILGADYDGHLRVVHNLLMPRSHSGHMLGQEDTRATALVWAGRRTWGWLAVLYKYLPFVNKALFYKLYKELMYPSIRKKKSKKWADLNRHFSKEDI